jgi:hypothetical protein
MTPPNPILLHTPEAGQLSPEEMYNILKEAGFTGDDLEYAFQMAWAEGKHQPNITNETAEEGEVGPLSYGIFQITPILLEEYYHKFMGDNGWGGLDPKLTGGPHRFHSIEDIKDWDEKELKAFLKPLNIARFTRFVVQEERRKGRDGWGSWTPHLMVENLKGDEDTPSEHFKDKGPEGAAKHGESLKTWHGSRYVTLPKDMAEAKDMFRQVEMVVDDKVKESIRNDNVLSGREHADGSFSFAEPVTSATPPTKPTETFQEDFNRMMAENPESRGPQSAFTNPATFVPQFARDGVSQQTDPRQAPEFQPNFITPNSIQ